MPIRNIRLNFFIWFAAGVCAGILVTWGFFAAGQTEHARAREKRMPRSQSFRLTSPLLECCEDCSPRTNLKAVKPRIQAFVDKSLEQGHANTISVYVRDLNNGPWFGINEQQEFSPASLLKIPTMMAYLKMADKDPLLLERRLFISQPIQTSPQMIPPQETITVNTEYTVQDLIRRMIVYSDNVAKEMLCRAVSEEDLMRIYRDIGIEDPQMNDYLTVRDYASFFRVLYNASYISWDLSEWALGLLLQTKMQHGIRAGVPASVPVASKFGEREFNDGLVQFHECGIVYAKNSPYIVCVMTRGADLAQLQRIVAEISRLMYVFISEHPAEGG